MYKIYLYIKWGYLKYYCIEFFEGVGYIVINFIPLLNNLILICSELTLILFKSLILSFFIIDVSYSICNCKINYNKINNDELKIFEGMSFIFYMIFSIYYIKNYFKLNSILFIRFLIHLLIVNILLVINRIEFNLRDYFKN